MMKISNFIIPLITIIIIIYGLVKKVNIFSSFNEGIREGLKLCLTIFPTIFSMFLAINILVKSNIIMDLANYLEPFFKLLRVPGELLPMIILRPISGSSSLAILNNLLITYGPDSFIGRVASVIQGSTDTTIYIIGLYFGSVGIKKIRYSLLVGLLTDLVCVILALVTVSLFF